LSCLVLVCFGQDNLLYFIFGRYWMEPSRSRTWTNPSLKTIEEELIQLDPFKNQVKNPLIFFLNYFLSKRPCFEKKFLVKTMLLWIFFLFGSTWVNPFEWWLGPYPRSILETSFKTMIIIIFILTLTWFNPGWPS